MTNRVDGLLPCPFCGGPPTTSGAGRYVFCANKPCTTYRRVYVFVSIKRGGKELAASLWNTRGGVSPETPKENACAPAAPDG